VQIEDGDQDSNTKGSPKKNHPMPRQVGEIREKHGGGRGRHSCKYGGKLQPRPEGEEMGRGRGDPGEVAPARPRTGGPHCAPSTATRASRPRGSQVRSYGGRNPGDAAPLPGRAPAPTLKSCNYYVKLFCAITINAITHAPIF
jgi:hypothetical protein